MLCLFQSNPNVRYLANGSALPIDAGLHLFKQLLANKVFLLLFVRTLEQQKDFGTSSKVHFASLLSVVLHSRMEYFTEYVIYSSAGSFESFIHHIMVAL